MAQNLAMLQALARQKAAGKPPRAVSIKPMENPVPTPTTIPGQTTITKTGNNSPNPTTPPRVEAIQPPGIRKGATAEIIFDPQIAAISQGKWPSTWKPFAADDPVAIDYIKGAYGDKVGQDLIDSAFKLYAPNYLKLESQFNAKYKDRAKINPLTYTFNDKLYSWLANGLGLEAIKEQIAAEAISSPGGFGGLKLDEASKMADDVFAEYDKANVQANANKESFLKTDKYYSAGLPHPKFKYGASTNYKMGTIDVKTAPYVQEYFNAMRDLSKTTFPGSSSASGTAIDKVLKANKDKTPFKDEAIRRQDLYKAQIVQK